MPDNLPFGKSSVFPYPTSCSENRKPGVFLIFVADFTTPQMIQRSWDPKWCLKLKGPICQILLPTSATSAIHLWCVWALTTLTALTVVVFLRVANQDDSRLLYCVRHTVVQVSLWNNNKVIVTVFSIHKILYVMGVNPVEGQGNTSPSCFAMRGTQYQMSPH